MTRSRWTLLVMPKEHRFAHAMAVSHAALSHVFCRQQDEALHLLTEALTEDAPRAAATPEHSW